MMGAVSPAARPMPKMEPVKMPGMALGNTILKVVCHLETPSDKDASRNVCGTDLSASSEAPMIVGRIKNPSVSDPDKMLDPNLRKMTKKPSPNNPKTTEGTPARQLMPTLMKRTTLPCLAYSVR